MKKKILIILTVLLSLLGYAREYDEYYVVVDGKKFYMPLSYDSYDERYYATSVVVDYNTYGAYNYYSIPFHFEGVILDDEGRIAATDIYGTSSFPGVATVFPLSLSGPSMVVEVGYSCTFTWLVTENGSNYGHVALGTYFAYDPVEGDVNGDQEFNIADINMIIDNVLSDEPALRYDINGDREVNLADISMLIDMLLSV